VNEPGNRGLPSLLKIFSGPESEKKTQFPFKTSKTILNKIKITIVRWIGNEAITYIPTTAMHSYFEFFMLNLSGLFIIYYYDSSTSKDFI
jgi:hypothetical protein